MAKKPTLSIQQRAFLAAYIESAGSITRAAEAVGVSRRIHYTWLVTDEAYKLAFDQADQEAGDVLVDLAIERAKIGYKRLVIYHGEVVMVPRDPTKPRSKKVPHYEYDISEGLHLALLKAKKPEMFKDRVQQELTGEDGGPVNLTVTFVKPK